MTPLDYAMVLFLVAVFAIGVGAVKNAVRINTLKRSVPDMFNGCDFCDTTMPDGTLLTTNYRPIILGRGNILFPKDWSAKKRAAFRAKNDIQGYQHNDLV